MVFSFIKLNQLDQPRSLFLPATGHVLSIPLFFIFIILLLYERYLIFFHNAHERRVTGIICHGTLEPICLGRTCAGS